MYVKDLDLFVMVRLLEDAPPVLSLGKSSAKITDIPMSGLVLKSHVLSKKRQKDTMQHGTLCAYRCSGLVNRVFQL